jgi:hypothetical protein
MTVIVQIDKTGTVKATNVKDLSRDLLYKKCGFRKSDGFEKRTTWKVKIGAETHYVELWARDAGKHNTENKYDFPPPCDTALYFGTCGLVGSDAAGEVLCDLTVELWDKIYEKLFGGFEDLGDEDEEASDDELASVPKEMKTKNGYLKDGFVIDNSEEGESSGNDVSEDEDEDGGDIVMELSSDGGSDDDDAEEEEDDEDDEDESGSELGEEAYDYSSDEN